MHGIEKPFDIILALKACWHGFENIVEKIDKETMRQYGLFFPITSSETLTFADDEPFHSRLQKMADLCQTKGTTLKQVFAEIERLAKTTESVDSHRTILGDLTAVRPDLVESGHPTKLVLHVPKSSYEIITNEEAFDTVHNVFGDSVQVVTAGTLHGCKVFFVSLDIGQCEYTGPRGDKFMQYLDVVTSHNGTLGTRLYDSGTRIVCMNTLIMSLHNRGNLDFTVYHSKNAAENLKKVSADLSAVFSARAEYFSTLEYFDTLPMTIEQARYLATHFLATWKLDKDDDLPREISTQIFNKAEEIGEVFKSGDGNRGANAYDFFNAITQVYTWGSGTGKNATKQEKFLSSRDGTAAEIKEFSVSYLNRPMESLLADMEQGEKWFREKALTRNK